MKLHESCRNGDTPCVERVQFLQAIFGQESGDGRKKTHIRSDPFWLLFLGAVLTEYVGQALIIHGFCYLEWSPASVTYEIVVGSFGDQQLYKIGVPKIYCPVERCIPYSCLISSLRLNHLLYVFVDLNLPETTCRP